MRYFFIFIFTFGLAACAAAWGVVEHLTTWSTEVRPIAAEVTFELRPRTSLKQLSQTLEDKGLIDSALKFHAWMRFNGGYEKFQAGTYQVQSEVSPTLLREKMEKGDIFVPLLLQIIIPEGFPLHMLNDRLATKGVAQLKELNKLVRDRTFIKSLGVDAPSLEGFTYPATYNFDKMPTAPEFYTRVVKRFFEKLPPNYEQMIRAKGLTMAQAVTFASLIELETMQADEKPLISEVIWNRLKRGDALGIDAAIIYGIANYQGDIKWQHLKDAKNRYNTRIHKGLPPTAIGAVSRSSLEAVLNPSNLGYYYYMLDAKDRSRHVFSKTIQEHNAAVQNFLRSERAQKVQPKRP